MKTIQINSIIFFFISMSIVSCQTSQDSKVLAVQGEYSLTKNHLEKHLSDLSAAGELSKEEIQSEKLLLIAMFKEAPEEILASLEETHTMPPTPNPTPDPAPNPASSNLAAGHQQVRAALGTDIGQMQFDTEKAQQFRTFMANSLLSSGSSSGDGSGGRSASNKIQFCADGSYVEYRSAHLGISVPGMDASGYDEDQIPGYWEVAALPNGMQIILLYSTHHLMLEDYPTGLLPFFVGQYAQDFVALPNGDGFSRTMNYCN
ncbi:hypothetical protein [Maribacter sp. 2308TA10-17]|uniref:hypothetical protein n=1 Tax=Maribacter sp. 2308TA10-17 TaxID=3386276 RepID=UPI0039BCBBE3